MGKSMILDDFKKINEYSKQLVLFTRQLKEEMASLGDQRAIQISTALYNGAADFNEWSNTQVQSER